MTTKRKGYYVEVCGSLHWRPTLARARKFGQNKAIECNRSTFKVRRDGKIDTYRVVKEYSGCGCGG